MTLIYDIHDENIDHILRIFFTDIGAIDKTRGITRFWIGLNLFNDDTVLQDILPARQKKGSLITITVYAL